jgi:hypothetical protein
MDSLILLDEARAAGLEVTTDGDRLVVRGPKRCESLARQLLAHKAELLTLLRQETRPQTYTPRHPGGLRLVDTTRPCKACGGVEIVQHVTYCYCLTCGREDSPGAVGNSEEG